MIPDLAHGSVLAWEVTRATMLPSPVRDWEIGAWLVTPLS